MTKVASDSPVKDVLSAAHEGERFERFMLARRRGVIDIAFGCAVLGLFLAGTDAWKGSSVEPAVRLAGYAAAFLGLAVYAALQIVWRRWEGIFGWDVAKPFPMREAFSLRRPDNLLALVVSLILLAFLFLNAVGHPALAGLPPAFGDFLFQAVFGTTVVGWGLRSRDPPLVVVAGSFMAVALANAFWQPPLLRGIAGGLLLLALPLLALGFFRLASPRRWLDH